MPRNGAGVFSKPAGTTAVSGTTIESSKYNQTIDDLVNDANLARPIVAGGTGATTASGARAALGLAIGPDIPDLNAANTFYGAITVDVAPNTYGFVYASGAGMAENSGGNLALRGADSAVNTVYYGADGGPDFATADATILSRKMADNRYGVLDEDDFASNSSARPPSQQSAKAYVDGKISALPFSKQYKSSVQTITSGGTRTLSHGMSEVPKLVQLRLRFTSAVHGYSVNDEIIVGSDLNEGDANRGVSVRLTASSVIVTYGSNSDVFKILDTSGSRTTLSNADARLIVYAWA